MTDRLFDLPVSVAAIGADQLARWDGRPLWIVDPLDGTANFLHSHPQYCASVAVAVEGRAVAGAVTSGSTGERWWAAAGLGAFKSGRRIHASSVNSLSRAMVGTGFPFKALELLPDYLRQFDRVLRAAAGVRRGGSAACHRFRPWRPSLLLGELYAAMISAVQANLYVVPLVPQ